MNSTKTLFSAVAVSFVLSVSGLAGAGEPDLSKQQLPKAALRTLEKARAAEARGDAKAALDLYQTAWDESGSDAIAAEVGLGCYRLKDYVLAARFLDRAMYGGYGAKSVREMNFLDQKLYAAQRHVVMIVLVTNVADPGIWVDEWDAQTTGVPMRLYVTPGKHVIKLSKEGYWDRVVEVNMKAGESVEISAPMAPRVYDRVAFLPSTSPILNVNPFAPREPEPWVRPTLVSSCVGIGVSLGAAGVGIALMVTGGTREDPTYRAGLGTVIAGSVGLGLSVIGIGVSIASIPPQPGIELRYGQEATPGATGKPSGRAMPPINVAPVIGKGYVGLQAGGVF